MPFSQPRPRPARLMPTDLSLSAQRAYRSIFSISRSHGYALAKAGLVRTVCLRKPGAIKGRRLWCCDSMRAYLRANMEELLP